MDTLTVVPEDRAVVLDGVVLIVDPDLWPETDANIHAMQWRDGQGRTEAKEGEGAPVSGKDLAPYVAAHQAQTERNAQAEKDALLAAEAALAARPATEKRAGRYAAECDSLLLAATGYALELAADPGSETLQAKLAAVRAEYLEAKTRIRAEIPD